jgi:hypothetical protein
VSDLDGQFREELKAFLGGIDFEDGTVDEWVL